LPKTNPAKTKSPLSDVASAGRTPEKCCLSVKQSQVYNRRRRAVRVMMVAVMDMRLHQQETTARKTGGQ
jgi:hypothetical protein